MFNSDTEIYMTSGGTTSGVKIAGWRVTRDVNTMITSWSIDFAEAMQIDTNARFTIQRAILPATLNLNDSQLRHVAGAGGTMYGGTVIRSAKPDEWIMQAGSDLACGCSGKTGESSYTETHMMDSVQKDLYFVNIDWLNTLTGGIAYWRLIDGALYWQIRSSRRRGTSAERKAWQIEHADLPSRGTDSTTYQIILDYRSHHEIGNYIAGLMGYTLRANTPDVRLRSVLHFSSGQSYMEMLNSLFSIWNPDIRFDESDEGEKKIWVLDTAGEDNTLNQPVKMSFSPKAIVSISEKDIGKAKDPTDHVLIKGAKDWNMNAVPDPGELSIMRLTTPLEFPEEDLHEYWWTESFSFGEGNKLLGDYTGGFNTANAEEQRRPKYVYRAEQWYISPTNDGMYLIRELDESFDEKGLIHAHSVNHLYGAGFKLIYTSEKEHGLIQKPGEPFKTFDLIRHTVIDQSWMIDGLERACTVEITEEPVVITEVYDAATGKMIKCGPVPISRSQEQGRTSKNPAANQRLIDMTTKKRVTKVNRACKGVLAQVTSEFDTISQTMKVSPQFLRDPRSKTNDERTQYRYEAYLPGQSVFHKKVTIEHPDICDDAIAQAICDRIFAKSAVNIQRKELSVEMAIPIPFFDTNFTVRIPAMWATSITGIATKSKKLISGGVYLVSQIDESCSIGLDGKISHSQQLTLRNYL
jgi:hypothetical protein